MGRIRFAVAGTGWRALFYVRAAKNLPELFELTGVLCRTAERAEGFAKEYGVAAFADLEALLGTEPEFVVSCIYKADLADMCIRLLERGVPALCETPLAVSLDKLAELRAVQQRTGVLLEMAEQYFLYPSHQARRALVRKGLLGDITYCYMSMMHDYHGVSMLRAYLGEESGPVRIRAHKTRTPIVVTGGRGGYITSGQMGEEYRVLAQLDYGDGRVGMYDFAGTQYHSAIRSNHLRILGTRGEIADNEVRWIDESNRPHLDNLIVNTDQISGTIRAISFGGERVYENPFRTDAAMTEDDIAVSTVLMRMGESVRGGERHYPYAFRDSYLSLVLTAAANDSADEAADAMNW